MSKIRYGRLNQPCYFGMYWPKAQRNTLVQIVPASNLPVVNQAFLVYFHHGVQHSVLLKDADINRIVDFRT